MMQSIAERPMRHYAERKVLITTGQVQEFLCLVPRCMQFPAPIMEIPRSPESGEFLREVSYALAKLTSTVICAPDIRRSNSLHVHQHWAEKELEIQFLLL